MYNPANILPCLTPQAMRSRKIATAGVSLKALKIPANPFSHREQSFLLLPFSPITFYQTCAIDSFYLIWSSQTKGATADLTHESSVTHFTQWELGFKIPFQQKQTAKDTTMPAV